MNPGLQTAADLAWRPVPSRKWWIDGWAVEPGLTLFAGPGGSGKSLLGLVLAFATAIGRDFGALKLTPGPALYLSAEDDAGELHRRLAAIAEGFNTDLADAGGNLALWDLRGRADITLGSVEADGCWVPSRFMGEVEAVASGMGCRVIVIDNASCVFAGNEVARIDVTGFCRALDGMALRLGASILLLHHPAKAQGSEWSGSTAWEAAVRSRWLLDRPGKNGDDDGPERILRLGKSNYGARGTEVRLSWHAGTFWPTDELPAGAVAGQKGGRQAADDRTCLELLAGFAMRGQPLSAARTAGNYAPRLMARLPDAGGVTVERLTDALERLLARGEIEARADLGRGPDRKPIYGIRAVNPAQADAGQLWGDA